MRRLLSWIVLYILNFVFYVAEFWVWNLGTMLFLSLYAFSRAIFWVALFLGGGEILLGLIYTGITYGGLGVIHLSQKVWRSKNGTRYKVIGILNIITYVLFLIFVIIGGPVGAPLIVNIAAYITMIIFGIIMITGRRDIVNEYGEPPTKREMLQAKLDKLDEEENWNSYRR